MTSSEPGLVPAGDTQVGASLGIEEEYHILDPGTGRLTAGAWELLERTGRGAKEIVEKEFKSSMIETVTPVCFDLDALRAAVVANRRTLVEAADRLGLWVAAAGTVPDAGATGIPVYPDERYQRIYRMYLQLAVEQQVCGCHVHVGVPDPDLAVRIIPRIRGWLPVLLALSASSPFFQHVDTGYDSYRSVVLGRWPTGGPPPIFPDRVQYWRAVDRLVHVGIITDRAMVYYDARPSARYPTVEIRVSDSCPRLDTAILIAGLARALIVMAAHEEQRGAPPAAIPDELLRGATWQAARSSLRAQLVDPAAGEALQAPTLVRRLLGHVRPALEAFGDWEFVAEAIEEMLQGGTSAQRQRRALRQRGEWGVAAALVAETRVAL